MSTQHASLIVFMANYNHGEFIGEALESILSQSLAPTEVIVVDDASTDNSIQVIEDYANRYGNVRLIRNTHNTRNRSHCKVVNDALLMETFEYIYIAAADDKLLPGFFEKSVGLLEEFPQAGLCATYPKFIDQSGNAIASEHIPAFHSHEVHVEIQLPTYLNPSQVLSRVRQQPWFIGGLVSVLIRRSALADAGGLILDLGMLTDWFVTHYVAFKFGICYIPEALVAFRILPKSMGANITEKPTLAMEQHVRAFQLMREPKYRKVFPPQFLDQQRRNFTYAPLRGAFVKWRLDFLRELNSLVPPRTLLDRSVLRLLRLLLIGSQIVLKIYCFRNLAEPFRGDHGQG